MKTLQDLGLCIQCLATHYLEFHTDQPLTLCLLYLKFLRSFFYYAGNFYYAGIMLHAINTLLWLKLRWHNRLNLHSMDMVRSQDDGAIRIVITSTSTTTTNITESGT